MPRPILSPQKLSQLSIAALHNCQDLLSTAKMLLGTDKFGRAHALATLAMEEFGKHVIAAAAITRSAYPGYDWVKFWKRINSHESKLRQAAIALDALRPDDKWLEDLTLVMASAKTEHGIKLHGLYVDVDSSGELCTPWVIPESDARRVVDAVDQLVTLYGKFFREPGDVARIGNEVATIPLPMTPDEVLAELVISVKLARETFGIDPALLTGSLFAGREEEEADDSL